MTAAGEKARQHGAVPLHELPATEARPPRPPDERDVACVRRAHRYPRRMSRASEAPTAVCAGSADTSRFPRKRERIHAASRSRRASSTSAAAVRAHRDPRQKVVQHARAGRRESRGRSSARLPVGTAVITASMPDLSLFAGCAGAAVCAAGTDSLFCEPHPPTANPCPARFAEQEACPRPSAVHHRLGEPSGAFPRGRRARVLPG